MIWTVLQGVADLVVHPLRNNSCSSYGYACYSFFLLLLLLYNWADSYFILRLVKCSHKLEVEQQDRVWVRQAVQLTLPVMGSRGSPVAATATQPNHQLSAGWDMVTALDGSSSTSLWQLFYSNLSTAASLPSYSATHSHLLGPIHTQTHAHAFLFLVHWVWEVLL